MLQEIRQLERCFYQQACIPVIAVEDYLGVPIRDMLVILSFALLTQRSNHIPEGTQAFVDILGFFQPILVIPSPALLESFRTSEVDEVERTFAGIPTRGVLPRYPKSKD